MQVQQALKNKKDKLSKIQQQVDQEVAQYKQELEADKRHQIQQVSELRQALFWHKKLTCSFDMYVETSND